MEDKVICPVCGWEEYLSIQICSSSDCNLTAFEIGRVGLNACKRRGSVYLDNKSMNAIQCLEEQQFSEEK